MKRFGIILFISILLNPLSSFALNDKGLNLVGEIPTPESDFYGSVIISLKTNKNWCCDLGNDFVLEVIPWDSKASDDYWEPLTQYKLYRKNTDGLYDLLSDKKIFGKTDASAVKMIQSPDRLSFYAQGGMNIFEDLQTMPVPLKKRSVVKIYAKSEKEVLKLQNNLTSYNLPQTVNFQLVEDYIKNVDMRTPIGEWKYLDRVTPKNHSVVIGGQYTLAVIPDNDFPGGLLIVYIDGLDENNDLWEKGDIKGRLKPTAFENHYDLEWYDTHRNVAGLGECSATFEGLNLLTFDFPLLGSQIRFQRFLNVQ